MILIIESSQWHILGLKSELEKARITPSQILSASNPEDAKAACQNHSFDTVIIRDYLTEGTKNEKKADEFFVEILNEIGCQPKSVIVLIDNAERYQNVVEQAYGQYSEIINLQEKSSTEKIISIVKKSGSST